MGHLGSDQGSQRPIMGLSRGLEACHGASWGQMPTQAQWGLFWGLMGLLRWQEVHFRPILGLSMGREGLDGPIQGVRGCLEAHFWGFLGLHRVTEIHFRAYWEISRGRRPILGISWAYTRGGDQMSIDFTRNCSAHLDQQDFLIFILFSPDHNACNASQMHLGAPFYDS